MEYFVVGVAALLVGIVVRALTMKPPCTVISNPILGVLNLIGKEGDEMVLEDLSKLRSFFRTVRQEQTKAPSCDVLMLYCDLASDGTVNGNRSVNSIIRDAGARIVVIANNHPGEVYGAAAKSPFGNVNLVLTLERNGVALSTFLLELFLLMQERVPMPIAWNRLVPQRPGADHSRYTSSSVCVMNAGHVVFDHQNRFGTPPI
jgi:hypothetical protein